MLTGNNLANDQSHPDPGHIAEKRHIKLLDVGYRLKVRYH